MSPVDPRLRQRASSKARKGGYERIRFITLQIVANSNPRRCQVKRSCLSAAAAIFLSGIALAVVGLSLNPRPDTSHASPARVPVAAPDLIISVDAVNETVLATGVITYITLYTNTLTSPLSDVIITATLSLKQIYSDTYGFLSDPVISTDSFTYSGNFDEGYTLEWQLGELDASAGGWIAVTTTVPAEAEPSWNDKDRWPLLGMSAVITTSTPGASSGNPQGLPGDDASVLVVGPVLQMTKASDPDTVRPGRLVTFALTLENKDRADVIPATGIVITDNMPLNTIFYAASGSGTYSPTSGGGVVIWHLPAPLARGATTEVSFTVRLTNSMPFCPAPKLKNLTYIVSANETIQPVEGEKLEIPIDDVLEKTIETSEPPPKWYEVFPGGIVTYTISIYNPLHDQRLENLRVTDTLPGTPNQFTFLHMLDGGPSPITTTPQVVWDDLEISPGGVLSFSFSAWVPYHIDIGSASKDYKNKLSASAPGPTICDMKDQRPSQATVTRQIVLDKKVEPNSVLSGGIVTYTITLDNLGDEEMMDIQLTDTLPADFYFVDMLYGPTPKLGYRYNPVVWDNLSVPAYGQKVLSFRAVAIGAPLREYENRLSASSPWTTIPSVLEAKVFIESPFTLNKVVDPTEVFVEQPVNYEIEICNVATGTYTIDGIEDKTHPGFVVEEPRVPGYPYYHRNFPLVSPATLEPGDCFPYPFSADVTVDVGCGNLPYTYWNEAWNVGFHIQDDPADWWYLNTAKLAPLLVKPHVTLVKEGDHAAVLPGETLGYTITLTNISAIPVTDITIQDTLPGDGDVDFSYISTVPGYPAPDTVDGNILVWEGRSIQPGQKLVLAFTVQVPELISYDKYKNAVYASTSDLACIETLELTAQVQVVEEIIELTKDVTPDEASPLGLVEYEIVLKNLDSVPITGVTVTDTLPSLAGYEFEFVGMASGGPEPSEVNGNQVIWRDLTIPGGGKLELKFDVRTVVLYGQYNNRVDAWCPRSQVISPKVPPGIAAPVNVLPSVLVAKTVFPTQTTNGTYVVYTITVHNQTDDPLTDLLITDTLPSGFRYWRTFEGPAPGFPRPERNYAVWTIDIGKNEIKDIVFQARVGSDVPSGSYYNRVDGYSSDALIPGMGDSAPVIVEATGEPYLSLDKTVAPSQTANGETVIYTVTLNNPKADVYAAVRITDTLPDGFYFVEMLGSDPIVPITTSPQVVWELDQLSSYASHDFRYQAQVGYSVSSGTYTSTVKADIPPYTFLEVEGTAPVEVNSTVEPGIFTSKTVIPTRTVNGGNVTYTIVFTNRTDGVLENVHITDVLPDGFSYLQTEIGPTPVVTSPQVEWEMTQVGVGESRELVFQAQVGLGVRSGSYANTVQGFVPPFATFGVAETAAVNVEGITPLASISKTVFPTRTANGGKLSYTITLENKADNILQNVRITDTLPTGFGFYASPGAGFTLVFTSPQVVWGFEEIGPRESRTFVLEARVGADVPVGVYTNTVQGSSPSGPILGVEGTAPVQVVVGAVLSKTVSPAQTANGGVVTYTITLENQSGTTIEDVYITDTLPIGFGFWEMLPPGPTPVLTSPQVVWDLADLGPGESKELAFQALVGPDVASGVYRNSVRGHSSASLIVGVSAIAPVKVDGTQVVFLPLLLRNYGQ
jgi:uncharacterized repeat protein (TIGR01451 family)